MKELEKCITDVRTGLKYELIEDQYFTANDDEPKNTVQSIFGGNNACDILSN